MFIILRNIIVLKTDMYSINVKFVTTGIYALLQNTPYTTTSSFCVDCSQLDNRKIVCKNFMSLIDGLKTFHVLVNSLLIINPIYG